MARRSADQLARLRKRFDAVPKAVRAAVRPVLDKSAEELVTRMQALAPVDDGDLRDSIRAEDGDHELSVRVQAGDDGAFYARWVEFGTANTPANPFFFVAYRLSKKRLQRRIKRAIGKSVREAWAQ